MSKNLQFFFFVLFLVFFPSFIKAQSDRINLSKIQEQETPVEKDVSFEKSTSKEKPEIKKSNPEFKKSELSYKLQDSTFQKQSLLKSENDNSSLSSDRVLISDNVTYEKEVLPVSEKTVSAEKNPVKVKPSENYKPRTVKADIHPVVDYSTAGIAADKRTYLEQEADVLQQEINLNAGKPEFDLAKKQKQLEGIRKMLQK